MIFAPTRTSNQHNIAFWLVALLLLTTSLALPSTALAQSSYVYVNNQSTSNSISAYSVSPTGALTAVPGSPFLTGGRGATVNCYGLDRIVISAASNSLFVANTLDLTITAFQVNPVSGSLTAVAGSPFATGLSLDACQGISLASTPDGKFLMASSNGQIQTFSIAANSALSLLATTPNCCTPMVSMKVSPNGQFLVTSNETSASVFTIDAATGALTPVLGSPFPKTGAGTLAGLEFSSCSNNLLYGGEATATSTITDAWSVAASGALTALAGSPFHSISGTNSNVVLLSPDNTRLFESNQLSNSVNSFTVNADGSLTNIGSFGGVGFFHTPAGMATDQSGNFLYVADDPFGIAVLRINTDGSLSNVSDTAIARPGQIQGVAAYPPRSCGNADLALTMTVAPNPAVVLTNVTYSITITNNGPDAAAASIQDILPAGKLFLVSCSATGGGVCSGSGNSRFISFPSLASGQSATATIVAQVSSTLANNSSLSNTATVSSSSAVDPNPANNSATATFTAVTLVPTTLSVAAVNGTFGGSASLSATLKRSADNSPIAGKSVAFTLNGSAAGSAVTDATGVASLTTSIAGIAVGTYPGAVVAKFAGDTSFAASNGTAPLVVSPAVLTVTGDNASRIYGDPNPAFTFTISGFVNGDTASVVTGGPSCTSAPPTSDIGVYPIVCTQGTLAAPNYSFTFVNGSLTVTPAALTVTTANASRLYGDPNPAFSGTLTGIKNGDNITATYACTATPASPIGTYPIIPTLVDPTAKLGNYTVSSSNGTLTVNPAPLSVTAANATRAYGDPNPLFTGTITGIKNADNITATYASAATAASPIGTYPIIATLADPAGKLSNYTVSVNAGTLTVSPALLTVTAANATRAFGAPNPVFTGTLTGVKNGDNITATFASAATAASPVGTYPIVPTLLDPAGKLTNYSVFTNNGVLTVTGASLTVTVDNASRLYGDPNPVFTGTITGIQNGDNITATYSSVADPASAVGTYAIVPTLVDPTGKLANYSVVIKNGILTVNPAPLSVTADNASRLYGDPNPAFTGAITGLKNNDNITAAFASAAAVSPVGTYPITPSLVDPTGKAGNYVVTFANGTLTVSPAPLSVTAANASRFYGDPNPAFSGTITGIKNGDNITASYSSTATAVSPLGTYPVVPALVDPTGKLSNYTVTAINNGILTVTPAPLTVTAASATRLYGDPNPVLSGTIAGIRNGDAITASYSTVATPASSVGTYAIVPALSDPTARLGNYTVISNNGTLTVSPAALTVTGTNATRLYGDPNPTLTGTVSGLKNGDTVTATFASAADATSLVGSYAIVATLADPGARLGNYTVVSSNGILAITPAPLSATATTASRVYGDPNPVFSGAIAGLKNGDNITATFVSAATAASPVGTYAIVPSFIDPAGKLGNYVVTSSGTLTVTPAPLTASANNATRLYGNANPLFTGVIAGLKNGDNITESFSSAGPLSPVGTYAIVPALVDPTGRAGNYIVTFSNGSLTVTPAPLSVAAANAIRLYGDPNPVFAGIITGIKNADNITATFATAATPASAIGTFAIVPSLVDPTGKLGNYIVTSSNGTLTINRAPLTVAAANVARTYGAANPALTGTVTGVKNADNITATYATTAIASSPVGTYPIAPTLTDPAARLGNYSVTSTNGVLTVNKAPLTITANNQTKILHAVNPALTATYSGFVLGQTPASLTGTLTCTTTSTTLTPVGSFPITCAGQSATNYAITFVPGALSVLYASGGLCHGATGHSILAPILANGTSSFLQGATVPARFRVCDARGVSQGTPGVVASFFLVKIITGATTTAVRQVPLGAPGFVFNTAAAQQRWEFNSITTSNLPKGSTYGYQIGLNDGTFINFQFAVR